MQRDHAFSPICIECMRIADNLSYLRAFHHSLPVPSHRWPGVQGTGTGRDERKYRGWHQTTELSELQGSQSSERVSGYKRWILPAAQMLLCRGFITCPEGGDVCENRRPPRSPPPPPSVEGKHEGDVDMNDRRKAEPQASPQSKNDPTTWNIHSGNIFSCILWMRPCLGLVKCFKNESHKLLPSMHKELSAGGKDCS